MSTKRALKKGRQNAHKKSFFLRHTQTQKKGKRPTQKTEINPLFFPHSLGPSGVAQHLHKEAGSAEFR